MEYFNKIQAIGTNLLESTEQYAKELATSSSNSSSELTEKEKELRELKAQYSQLKLENKRLTSGQDNQEEMKQILQKNKELNNTLDSLRIKAKNKITELHEKISVLEREKKEEGEKFKKELESFQSAAVVVQEAHSAGDSNINGAVDTMDTATNTSTSAISTTESATCTNLVVAVESATNTDPLNLNPNPNPSSKFESQVRSLEAENSNLKSKLEEQLNVSKALEHQIEDLFKQTKLLRLKDQEIQKQALLLETEKKKIISLEKKEEDFVLTIDNLEKDKNAVLDELNELRLRFERVEREYLEARDQLLNSSELLKEKKMVEMNFSELTEKYEQLMVESSSVKQEHLSNQESLLNQIESLKVELESLEIEKSKHQLDIENINEIHANNMANLIKQNEEIKRDSLDLEKDLKSKLNIKVEQVESYQSEIEQLISKLTLKESEISQLQQKITSQEEHFREFYDKHTSRVSPVATEAAHHQLSTQLEHQYEPQIPQELLDRLSSLEQENTRLRDRCVRSELILRDLETNQRNNGSNVTLLYGDKYKKNDDNDLEMGTRQDRIGFLILIDKLSVNIGYYLGDRPILRIAALAYIGILHGILLMTILK